MLEIDNVMRLISQFWCPTLRKLLFCFFIVLLFFFVVNLKTTQLYVVVSRVFKIIIVDIFQSSN